MFSDNDSRPRYLIVHGEKETKGDEVCMRITKLLFLHQAETRGGGEKKHDQNALSRDLLRTRWRERKKGCVNKITMIQSQGEGAHVVMYNSRTKAI